MWGHLNTWPVKGWHFDISRIQTTTVTLETTVGRTKQLIRQDSWLPPTYAVTSPYSGIEISPESAGILESKSLPSQVLFGAILIMHERTNMDIQEFWCYGNCARGIFCTENTSLLAGNLYIFIFSRLRLAVQKTAFVSIHPRTHPPTKNFEL